MATVELCSAVAQILAIRGKICSNYSFLFHLFSIISNFFCNIFFLCTRFDKTSIILMKSGVRHRYNKLANKSDGQRSLFNYNTECKYQTHRPVDGVPVKSKYLFQLSVLSMVDSIFIHTFCPVLQKPLANSPINPLSISLSKKVITNEAHTMSPETHTNPWSNTSRYEKK